MTREDHSRRQPDSDMREIVSEIARLTGLLSQWNGHLELVTEPGRAFGGKSFSCMVRIHADILETPLYWPTLLHEAMHSFSVGRSPDASLTYPGYEEGVVEQLQRLFRPGLLERLGVSVDPAAFVDRDDNSAYTDYANALESMREALGSEPKHFYVQLLGTPLEERWGLLREQVQQAILWRNADVRRQWKHWERILRGAGN